MTALWLGLLVAFALSPSLAETARHLGEEPWKSSALVVPLLLVALARVERQPGAPLRRGALAWIALAVAWELFAAGSGVLRWSRLSLGLAGYGWLRATSLTRPASAALAFLAVPIPSFASLLTSPFLEHTWARLASQVLPGVGPYRFPVDLHHGDGGVHLTVLGTALGLYAGLRFGQPPLRRLGLAGVGALGLVLLQPLAVTLAGGIGQMVGAEGGRRFLDFALPWAAGAAVLLSVERRAPGPAEAAA